VLFLPWRAVPWLRLACQHRAPAWISHQSLRDLWWTEWYCDRFFSEYLSFSLSVSFHSRYHCWQLVFPLSDYQVRLSKILNAKKSKIKVLREMNTEAERKKSFGTYIPEDFQRRYANVIIDLEYLNRDLQDYLTNVQNYCQEVSSNTNRYLCMIHVHLLLNISYPTFRISFICQYNPPYVECKATKCLSEICNLAFYYWPLEQGIRNSIRR
jgi:hypothetical protein